MPDREIIRRNLRNARENRSITQQAAAEHVGLSRTLIAQIELGNRPVSPDELAKLAELYGQSVVDLVGEEAPGNDDLLLMLFDLAPETLSKGARTRVSDILDLCREAASIEEALGRGQKPALPRYEEGRPRTATEALTQGERVALEERRRLGLGRSAVPDLSQLLATQGVRSAVVDLPDDIGGVCFQHDSLGTALWINGRHSDLQQRYALAHEYSHVLLDRDRSVVVTKRGNAGELVEKRANAFAAAFLLPADGVRQVLASFDKDQGSRRTYVAYDELRKEGIRAEGRTAPGSQAITYADVCTLARRFRVSYSAVVHRLRALDVVADVDMKALLGRKSLVAAERLLATFDSHSAGRRSRADGEAVDLKFEVVSLAVEGYRRGVVDASRLERVASKLRLPQLSSTELLELADAAR